MTTASLTIHLFGPMRVLVHGKPMPRVRARSAEWLLALLVLRSGRTVQRSWLAGTLWPDSEETQALQNLRHALLSLRKALEPEEGRLQSPTRDTLTLDLSDIETDVLRFDQAIRKREAAALQSAVEVYAGPLLEGCLEEWVFPERASREQACLRALETLADAAEQRKNYAEALGLLRRAQGMDALRDTTQRALMRVLSASGDAPAALASYRDYRLLLREQMNVDPDEETVGLYQQIREQAKQAKQHRDTTIQEARPSPASSPITPAHPSALPHPLTALIGREQETREIAEALSRSRLVTLVGGGGVGKTRLAIQVATHLAFDTAQEVAFVALASLSDPTLLPAFVANALGMREGATAEPILRIQALTGWLCTHQILLVLDNCEHLIEAAASLTQILLERCPDLHILTTSRQRLGLTGEVVWRVPSLPVPEMEQLPANSADAAAAALTFPAIRLFVERASSAHREFQLTRHEEVEAVCRICRRLDGIPLAIELAAARVCSLTVEDIHNKLDQRFRLLTGGSRTSLPRQQTLRSLIDWSYDLLNKVEKALLCQLSVFASGWTLEAAEMVCMGDPVEEWETLDLLTSLTDKSLVVAETAGVSVRYRLLETVRQYAWEKLTGSGETEKVRQRHQYFYLGLAEEAARHLRGPEQSVWLQRLETERDNVRAALEGEDKDANLRIAAALWWFWFVRGHLSEGRARLHETISQAGQTQGQGGKQEASRATALHGSGVLAYAQGDYVMARTQYEASQALWREIGDKGGIASSLHNLGNLAYAQGDYVLARTQYEESLALRRELGDKGGTASSLHNLGNVAISRGDYEAARMLHEESLAFRRELGDKGGIASSLGNLGNLTCVQGDYEAARVLCEESLAIRREIGDKGGIADSLGNLGSVALSRGDYEVARRLHEESLALLRELGDKGGIASSLGNLGDVAYAQSNYMVAQTQFEESLALRRELGDKGNIAASLEGLAAVVAAQGQGDQAAQVWGAASALRNAIGSSLSPRDQKEYDRQVASARQALGEEAFSAAWAQGRAITLEQAIRFALSETSA